MNAPLAHGPIAIRQWSRGEELANSISHGIGFIAAVIGVPFLFAAAAHHPSVRAYLGMGVFAATTMLLYLSSAVHHWLLPGKAKQFFLILDHAAIFLMIAGSYTPLSLGILWGPWGWLLLALVWPLAIFGVLVKSLRGVQPKVFTISLYVLMGWVALVAFKPLLAHMAPTGVELLVAGGIAYTGGLVFYVARRFPYHHLAWHLAVMVGTVFHFIAIWRYAF